MLLGTKFSKQIFITSFVHFCIIHSTMGPTATPQTIVYWNSMESYQYTHLLLPFFCTQ